MAIGHGTDYSWSSVNCHWSSINDHWTTVNNILSYVKTSLKLLSLILDFYSIDFLLLIIDSCSCSLKYVSFYGLCYILSFKVYMTSKHLSNILVSFEIYLQLLIIDSCSCSLSTYFYSIWSLLLLKVSVWILSFSLISLTPMTLAFS